MILQMFGTIQNPLCQLNSSCYGDIVGTGGAGGLGGFLSNVFQLVAIAGGLFMLFNFVSAGYSYITSQGDPKGIESAKNKIFMSIVGMFVIAGSFVFAAILGQILFGNPLFILSPTIKGPGTP